MLIGITNVIYSIDATLPDVDAAELWMLMFQNQ